MNRVPISKTKIETKLAIIRESLEALKEMGEMDKDSFLSDYKNFDLISKLFKFQITNLK